MASIVHRISDDGQSLVCESSPDSFCRMAPNCDSETWERDGGCNDHRDVVNGFPDPSTGHPVTPGHDCWMVNGHINPLALDETYGNFYDGVPVIRPGESVEIEFHGTDEGCTWDYRDDVTPGKS